jgi:hypothetical protein
LVSEKLINEELAVPAAHEIIGWSCARGRTDGLKHTSLVRLFWPEAEWRLPGDEKAKRTFDGRESNGMIRPQPTLKVGPLNVRE